MLRFRRVMVGGLLIGMAALMTWSFAPPAPGQGVIIQKAEVVVQPVPPRPAIMTTEKAKKDNGARTSQFSAVKLIENSVYRQFLNVARDCIKDKAWGDAVTALQKILDTPEDYYVQVREEDDSGREVVRWASVKFAASNLLGSMPDEGLDVYEQRFGGKAMTLLKQAKDAGDQELLAEAAHRYFHTRAGVEANERLATQLLDRSQYFLAALRFGRLLRLPAERFPVADLTLFKAALAYRRAGNLKTADSLWQKLEDRAGGREVVRSGDQEIALAKLRGFFRNDNIQVTFGLHDWPMVRGDVANNAQAVGSPPLLDQVSWTRKLLLDNDPSLAEARYHEIERPTKAQVDAVLNNEANRVALPGFFPVAAKGRLVYRSYGQLRCVALRSLEFVDDSGDKQAFGPGETIWRSTDKDGSVVRLLADKDLSKIVQPWLTNYASFPGFANLLFENTTVGTLSTDQQNVYAIDDLTIPPPDNVLQPPNPFMGMPQTTLPAEIRPLVMQNVLYAYNLQNGRLVWFLGGNPVKEGGPKDEFADSHFLGAPISVGGKLYVLNEKNTGNSGDAELRLVCIEPNKLVEKWRPAVVQPIQVLGMIDQRNRVTHAISRRINAAHLAYGEGILVCPTNAGEVLGVDLISRSLAWAYPYRERPPSEVALGNMPVNVNQPVFGRASSLAMSTVTVAKWKSTPPVVVDGKVVFTAPDADSVHCVNLHDGTPRWKVGRLDGDIFFAGVVANKVLIVGRNHLRALNLNDGTPAWAITTGDLPSGLGVASSNVYYLPLKKGEILAVDIERGAIKAHNRAKSSSVTPGNLVFSDGSVISVTPYEVTAYPQLQARLEVAERDVQKHPGDLARLVARGEILLADGQVQRAVDDLRGALQGKLTADLEKRAKDRLYDALTDLLQADFAKVSARYLDEYRALCQLGDMPRDVQLRQARFFRIVGNGRENEGDLIEAFRMYKEFGSLSIHREQGGVASLDDPSIKVPVDVWLRGRVSAMFARATPEQRAPLERKIAEEWQMVEKKNDVDAIRAFVGMFDVAFAVGREARLRLADAILERNDASAFLEAELSLYQLRGPDYRPDAAAGGRALDGLARLEERKNSAGAMQAATAYYRELAREFPDAQVRKGRTGRQLFDVLAADKRLLPYLEEGGSGAGAPVMARELNGLGSVGNPQQNASSVLHAEGQPSPFMRRHRLILDIGMANPTPRVSLVDLATGKPRWGPLPLPNLPGNLNTLQLYLANQANQNLNPNARFRFYQGVGHLVVVQVGTRAYCIDAEQGRLLWNESLLEGTAQQPNMIAQLLANPEGYLDLILYNQFNGGQRSRSAVGHVGAVQANYVALVTQQGLLVLDPLRGTHLWKKIDVPPSARVFGDDQYLFVVEIGEGGAIAATRAFRASDGEPVQVSGFGREYQNRIRTVGRRLLTLTPGGGKMNLRLYDVAEGKDVWSRALEPQAAVVHTEDPDLTGFVDPQGRLVVLDAVGGKELLNTSFVQGRIGLEEVRSLHQPLLVADADRFYLALNRPVDGAKVNGSVIANNFQNGLRSRQLNGWLLAFWRHDGEVRLGRKVVQAQKGELAWHSDQPLSNQMLVLEQFDQLPVLLLTARYNQILPPAGNSWVATTLALHKQTGKVVYESGARPALNNFTAHFIDLQADPRQGAINLLGHSYSVQFYVDDGRKVDVPQGLVVTTHLSPAPAQAGQPALPVAAPAARVNIMIRAPLVRQVLPAVPAQVPPP